MVLVTKTADKKNSSKICSCIEKISALCKRDCIVKVFFIVKGLHTLSAMIVLCFLLYSFAFTGPFTPDLSGL